MSLFIYFVLGLFIYRCLEVERIGIYVRGEGSHQNIAGNRVKSLERAEKCFFLAKITGVYIDIMYQPPLKIYENDVGDCQV